MDGAALSAINGAVKFSQENLRNTNDRTSFVWPDFQKPWMAQHAAVTPCNQNFIERIPEWVYNLGAVQ